MNSEQFELFTTLFLLNLAKQQRTLTTGLISNSDEKENVDQVNNKNFSFSGTSQLEPPTPPRTPIISAGTSNGDTRTPVKGLSGHTSKTKPTITLTPTSKLLADHHRRGSVSDLSDTEETSKNVTKQKNKQHYSDLDDNFSDRESNKAYDFSRFNDDSNMSDAGNNSDQDSDMGLTIDSNNSFESRLSLPNTRKLMDNKSQTPLVRMNSFCVKLTDAHHINYYFLCFSAIFITVVTSCPTPKRSGRETTIR